MKRLWLAFLLSGSLASAEPKPILVDHLPISLGGEWWFRLGHDPAYSSPFREKTHWQAIQVPGSWSKQGFRGYSGHAWFRIVFQLPSRYANETLGLDLGILKDADEVFLNGQRVGTSGSFPPTFQSAILHRRIYPLPQSKLRLGEFNELAVHIYSDGLAGGFLGPVPKLDRYDRLAVQQTGRDVVLWLSACVLWVLALYHLLLKAFYGAGREQWTWVGFLLSFSCFLITYAAWGPKLFLTPETVVRVHIATELLALGLLAPMMAIVLGRPLTTFPLVITATSTVGAGFTLVWRSTGILTIWVYLIGVTVAVVGAATLWRLGQERASFHRGQWPLLISSGLFFASALADVAVGLGWLPRPSLPGVVLFSSLGVIPFAFAVSFSLTERWSQLQGVGLFSSLGLLPQGHFMHKVKQRLSLATPKPFAVAALRFTSPAGNPLEVNLVVPELRRQVRHCDLLTRFSQETVLLLLDGMDEREAVPYLERMRRTLRQVPGGPQIRLTAGVVAFRPARFANPQELIKAAEAALYAARSEGGDCVATAP